MNSLNRDGVKKKEEEAKAKLLDYIWGSKKEQDFSRKVWDLMLLEQEHNPMGITKTYWKNEPTK